MLADSFVKPGWERAAYRVADLANEKMYFWCQTASPTQLATMTARLKSHGFIDYDEFFINGNTLFLSDSALFKATPSMAMAATSTPVGTLTIAVGTTQNPQATTLTGEMVDLANSSKLEIN